VKDTSNVLIKHQIQTDTCNDASVNKNIPTSNYIEKESEIDQQLNINSCVQNMDLSNINGLDVYIQIPEIGLHFKKKIGDTDDNIKNITNDIKKLNKLLKKKIKDNKRKNYVVNESTQNDISQESNGKYFTDFQKSIYAQQIRMHIQLTTQHFLQTYSHPEFWKYANKFKLFLVCIKIIILIII